MQSKRYQSAAHRVAFASLSIAAAALTMGAMVVLPAEIELGDFEEAAWLVASASPARIAVIDDDCADEPAAGRDRHGRRFACESCRSWSAAPVNAFTLWKPSAVSVSRGASHVGVHQKTEKSQRKFCKLCGGHLLTDHPLWGLVDVYAATIPTYRHEPTVHVNYGEAVFRIRDGLPKMKDMPKEMGGSGITLPE